jgi:membrane-bound lytic murein transglycosylase A
MRLRTVIVVALVALACRTPQTPPPATPEKPPEPAKSAPDALVELSPEQFPQLLDDGDRASLGVAVGRSLKQFERLEKSDPKRLLSFGRERVAVSRVADSLRLFRDLLGSTTTAAELDAAVRQRFRVFQSTGEGVERNVLFTGYYLPELEASSTRTPQHPWPLHAPPDDLVTVRAKDFPSLTADLVGRVVDGQLRPYPSRGEIAQSPPPEKSVIAWVTSSIDAFFMEIQGSGVLRYADGRTRVATFAGKNGHPYVAIGGELLRRGELARDKISMQSIRAWLEAHPETRDEVMQANPSYVFFRLADDAIGSMGVPVTAGRSLATDTKVFPKGALAFVATTRPRADGSATPFTRFMLDQDTGGAIRTAAHVDVFLGAGNDAAETAGLMKQPGRLYYLLAR